MEGKSQLQPGAELNAAVAEALGFNVIWLDDYYGHTPYIWDKDAQRTPSGWTNCHLLGADTVKGRNDAGEVVEIRGCIAPGFSTTGDGLLEAVRLMRERGYEYSISGAGPLSLATFTLAGGATSSEAFSAYAETLPHAVSLAIVSARKRT